VMSSLATAGRTVKGAAGRKNLRLTGFYRVRHEARYGPARGAGDYN